MAGSISRFKNPSQPQKVVMPEVIDREWVEKQKPLRSVQKCDCLLDFSNTKRVDSAGIGYIRAMHKHYVKNGGSLILANIPRQYLEILKSNKALRNLSYGDKNRSVFLNFADKFIDIIKQSTEALSVLVEMLYWGTIGVLKKQDFKKGALGEQMYQLGYRAIFIVGLLSFLIGIVLALQTAMQLRTYGAGIFLAPLIGITMVREMGPLLTAIILAGRTGSATTAEIATMQVNEEIDALRTMGINPIQFVVVPKFWAITVTMPLLTIISTTAGIVGGYLIGVFYLDLSTALFLNELSKNLHLKDINACFVKTVVFSWLIIWIGSFYGFRVRGGAEAV